MVTKLASVAIEDYLIKTRRIFHQYPELSFKEFETSKRIERELTRMGLAPIRMAKTGLIADIQGKSKGKTVAIRADIDALPVTEENTFDYRSKREGVMHACGHDSHITMALGAAKLLSAKRDFKGTVRMLFQPAEESPPGGAIEMIREGALNGVDYIIGQHVASEIPSGKVGIYYGAMMANADEIRVKLEGVGGHGAAPHETTDALLIASEFVVQAQTIVSRRVPPFNPAVVTFGTLNSGYRYNIIAKYAELTGTVRTFDKGTQDLIGKELKRILDGLSKATGCKYEFSYIKGYPATINNERVSKVVEEAASEVLGEEGVVHPNPSMGGEDFAYYLRKIPGAYYFLGIGNKEKGIVSPEHSSTHKIDESVLKYGTEILQRSAKKLLS
ncbi:MAG: amidohydrolase [Thermoplasmatales archaeon]|nr:amidohydrolase [Candidatus Thermoplasmatota archaeon]MCL6002572.1 amidohydrolase [Candidatus Thermoplasmatota archaeon]MDA8055645.1 amidohydrolase [Thermoplasmatales archaeon]